MKPSHQWTLGGELIKLSGRDSLREAMVALNLATPLGGQVHLLDEKSLWQRAGSESYIYRFAITQDDKTTQCLIKACVGYSPTNNLNALLESWVSRRRVLDEHGISTPVLFGWGKGELVEEYVPYSLAEVLTKKNNAMEQILDLLATYAGVLSSLGFSPICPFRDLRSRGEDVVVIDFGEDLGPPGVFTKKRSVVFDMLQTYLRGFYLQLSDDVIDRLRSRFAANGGEFLH